MPPSPSPSPSTAKLSRMAQSPQDGGVGTCLTFMEEDGMESGGWLQMEWGWGIEWLLSCPSFGVSLPIIPCSPSMLMTMDGIINSREAWLRPGSFHTVLWKQAHCSPGPPGDGSNIMPGDRCS